MSEHETPQPQDDGDDKPLPSNKAIPLERALQVLECGSVEIEHGMMRWSSNYTFLLSVKHDEVSVLCVYKPRKGERPLWDFPDGTLCKREYAAFLVSQALGWQVVPPTVLREGPRGLGSMQFFVDHDPEYNYFSFEPTLQPQLMVLALFDVITNNADRKGGHCLVDESGHLWGIDHGLTFHPSNKLRTVIWDFAGQPVAENLLGDLDHLCATLEPGQTLHDALITLLADHEITAFQQRVKRILKTKKYPNPGSGPNYPWPPV